MPDMTLAELEELMETLKGLRARIERIERESGTAVPADRHLSLVGEPSA